MAGARPILGLIAWILLAGGCLLSFFIVLSGGVTGSPINKVYFLQAATGGIGSSPTPSAAWTWNSVCTYTNGLTTACEKATAASPFDPARNFGATTRLPQTFISNGGYYYAMSKAAWALYLVALFFGVLALLMGILGLCTRIGAVLTSFLAFMAMVVQAAAAAVMTAWTVQARNAFRGAGIGADLGRFAYGFTWATLVCFFLASLLYCCGGIAGRGKKDKDVDDMPREPRQRTGFFSRNKADASGPGMATTGIKDDYS